MWRLMCVVGDSQSVAFTTDAIYSNKSRGLQDCAVRPFNMTSCICNIMLCFRQTHLDRACFGFDRHVMLHRSCFVFDTHMMLDQAYATSPPFLDNLHFEQFVK